MARPELVAVSGCTFRCHAVGLPLSYVVPSKVIEPLPRDEAAAASASRNEEGRFKDDLERPVRWAPTLVLRSMLPSIQSQRSVAGMPSFWVGVW